MSRVVIIPARSGSKRIPCKNIRPFAGKPIIAYPIEAARESGLFSRIIVSTDSEDVAAVAREFGAETPFLRPATLSDDFTGTGAVVWHALDWLRKDGEQIDAICCIYATTPLVTAENLRAGYALLMESKAPSLVSVATFPSPIFRAFTVGEEGRLKLLWPEYYRVRSQDLPEAYHDAGQFYWAVADRFLTERKFYMEGAVPCKLPRYFVQDIDTLEDWAYAELMYQVLHHAKKLS